MKKIFCLLLIATVASGILFPACHVGRFFIYNFANITDYKKFPSRTISRGDTPFHFIESNDTSNLAISLKGEYGSMTSFEETLETNKTVAFLVIQNDTLKYQWYAPKFDESDIVTSFSMSKSFISALIGIALEEGHIQSLDEPITNYIKLFKNEGFDKITIQHLLDMRTGIDYNENYYNPFGNVATGYYGRNLDRHIRHLKIKSNPGEKFEYISIATQLLGNILKAATGNTVGDYMEEKVWTQIGAIEDATWSLDRKNGREKSFCCINAVAKDFAKFGRLYLNNGNWNGRQLIPETWIKSSVTIHERTKNNTYQNQWWLLGPSNINIPNKVNYAAQGHLGQIIHINPVNQTIIVRFGKDWGRIRWTALMNEISKSL